MASHESTTVEGQPDGLELVKIDPSNHQSVNQTNGHPYPSPHHSQQTSEDQAKLVHQQSMKQGEAHMSTYQKLHASLWKDMPKLSITYRDVSYQHIVPSTDGAIPGVDKSFFNFFLLKNWTIKPTTFIAMQPNTGIVRPGTMTLLLAPPGHGKSTLLKTLSGRYIDDKRLSGSVKWNGLNAAESRSQHININRMTAFVDQGEAHNALMTVRETFQFALDNAVADPSLLQSPEFVKASSEKVDYMIDLLGLREAANTILGNAMIRGVSGGQRRRVSIGEMIITDARALFLDEITTGLDSSASFDILNSLRKWTRSMNGSVVTALLQPTPECFGLFDRLILMRHGAIVYDGPREGLEAYFNSIGIPIPDDQDLGDFLSDFLTDPSMVYYRTLYRASRRAGIELAAPSVTEVATINGSSNQTDHYRAQSPVIQPIDEMKEGHVVNVSSSELDTQSSSDAEDPLKVQNTQISSSKAQDTLLLAQKISSPPLSTSALKSAWVASEYYAANLREIEAVESQSKQNWLNEWSEYTKAQFASAYPRTYWEHAKYNFRRSAEDMKRNKGFYMPRIFQAVFIGFILGGLFYQTNPSDYQAKLGLLIFAIVNVAFANASEIPFAAEGKAVVFKQVDAGFYPTSSYALSVIITNLPLSIVESVIMVSIIYFLLGFSLDAGRYFFFLLMTWVTDVALSVVFRGITWGTKNADVANQVAPPVVATMFLSAGYLILYGPFPRWLIWLYELSPFTWALRALAINEFYDDRFDYPSPDQRFQGMSAGEAYLRSWDIDPTWAYKWAGVGYVIGFFFVFATLSSVILAYTRYPLTVGTRRFADEEDVEQAVEEAQDRLEKRVVTPNGNGEATTVEVQPVTLDAQHRQRAVASALKYASSFKLQTAATALPFIPVDLAWRDIHYTVTVKNEDGKAVDRKLLAGIDGFATAGTLTALMGSSGAGKTTLMDVIAGRKTAGKIEGDILVNGYPKRTATFNRLCGYVEQTDNHNPALTVRESLAFSAKLRLPRSVTAEQRDKFVEEILDILELKPIADRIIGDDINPGLSPGQLKRVTIGVELASNPSVLFLDEPTSGLDSRAALIVMRVVKRISKTGRAVLCTIHQPSQELFFLFDRLLLLKSGGQTVYFGNVGNDGEDLVKYFENAPVPAGAVKPHRPPTTNPASWMLDVIGAGTAGNHSNKPKADYLQIYRDSQLKQLAIKELEPLLKPNPSRPELEFDSHYAASYLTQYIEVQKRVFTSYWRNPSFVWIRQGLMVFLGAFLGFLYLQLGEGSPQSIITKLSAIFVGIAFPSWTIMSSALALFMRWRTVFYREQSSRMYAPFTYALATTIAEIFHTCWSTIVFLSLFYPMVGFPNNANSFFRYFFVQYLQMFTWISLGHFLAAALPNIMVGNIMASLIGTFCMLFSGMFRLAGSMPPGWKWIYYLSWIPKAIIPMTVVVFECEGSDCTMLENVRGPNNEEWGTISSYQFALNYIGAGGWYWEWIGYLFLSIVVLRIFYFLCVSKVSYLER